MIKLVVFDFDGVVTNGKVFFDGLGHINKFYNIKDGMGLKLLRENNINVGIISGFKENKSQIEIINHLKVNRYSLGDKDKITTLKKWCDELNIKLEEVAYMGDDINDISIINEISLSGCPKDAVKEVRDICYFKSTKNGGEGCIREFCDYIVSNNKMEKIDLITEIKNEFNYQINNFNVKDIENLANEIKDITGNVYFCGVGKSGNIAKHCCDLLKCISITCFFFDILNSTHGDIGVLNNNDIILMFSNSGNTKEVVELIPLFKKIGIKTVGICCNEKSKFKELSDITIITPFREEISGEINKIPTNSYMSHLLFSNILVSILKTNISLDMYKENHLSGNIGRKLQKIKDCIITEYPRIELSKDIQINNIFFEMTKYLIGYCFFTDKNGNLLGILSDGDIRRLLIEDPEKKLINFDDINKNYYFETDFNKYIISCKNYSYIPILIDGKIIGIISNIH